MENRWESMLCPIYCIQRNTGGFSGIALLYRGTALCIQRSINALLGYRWESLCCPLLWIPRSTRGSVGVAVLYKKKLHVRVDVMQKDVDAYYVDMNQKQGSSRTIYCNLLLSTYLLELCTFI